MDTYVGVDRGNDITSSAVLQAINASHLMYNLRKGNSFSGVHHTVCSVQLGLPSFG